MWFLFGFVTISLSIAFEVWRRHLFRWSVDGVTRAGHDYNHSVGKMKVQSLRLGVSCSPDASFSIKRQSSFDSFFKNIGVSNEYETGDKDFDDAYYLISDNKFLLTAIASSENYRTVVKKIMAFGMSSSLKTSEIHCRGGRLWIEFEAGSDYKESKVESVSKALAKELNTLLQLVNDVLAASGSRWQDPFIYKALFVLAVSSGLAINGGIQYFRTTFGETPFTLYPKELAVDALIYSLISLPLLMLIVLYWLGRGARTHLVLFELMTVGAFGLFSSIAFEMRDINIEFDKSKPKFYETAIIEKHTSTRRRRVVHSISVKNWNCDCGTYSIPLPETASRLASVSNPVMVAQHAGYLGYPWVSKVDVHWYGR